MSKGRFGQGTEIGLDLVQLSYLIVQGIGRGTEIAKGGKLSGVGSMERWFYGGTGGFKFSCSCLRMVPSFLSGDG